MNMEKSKNAWRGVQEIIFPVRCLGCQILHSSLCSICNSDFLLSLQQSKIAERKFISSRMYSNVAKRILLASKEQGIVKADEYVKIALRESLIGFCKNMKINESHISLVPIPSTAQSNRRRGRDYLHHITRQVARKTPFLVESVLEHNRKVRDHSELKAAERFTNIAGALTTKEQKRRPRNILLVDDLLTTGATMAEAIRALEGAGYCVIGGITAFLAEPLR